MQKLMARDNLGKQGKSAEVKVEMFKRKSAEVKGVISSVRLDLNEEEIRQSRVGHQANSVKRLPYRSQEGVRPISSVLICFASTTLPTI